MEHAATRPSKPSSNISEIVSKFAKVCKLRSIGVISSENANQKNHHHHNYHNPNNITSSLGEDSSDATEETECYGEKVHPQPVEVLGRSNVCADGEIMKLFDRVSALKLAYVQLQEAHIPYKPEKIMAADELVVAQLEVLCKIKHAYKEKKVTNKAKLDSSACSHLQVEIESSERLLEDLKSQVNVKDVEILRLKQELQELEVANVGLVEKMSQISMEKKNARVLSITLEDAFKASSKSIHDFSKPLISLMKASGWDLDLAAKSIEDAVVYSKRSHKKYAFEAYIARIMFFGISFKSYDIDAVMRFDDPIDTLTEYPNSDFAEFCRKKYLLVVHPMLEVSFFGNLDHRAFLLSGKHPRTLFYHIFAKMAKWVWVLQGIAASIDPQAKIFTVDRGSKFSDVYMESVEDLEGATVADQEQVIPRVELMVMPGFKIGESFMRSRVYLSDLR
ncbi:protein GRAVITROPIC IN THE LIGHT 1-like [Juglans microcarpa x Juglans regia]|uniref:protein GRAVITROPIC IN THE LIGHT 1-like n=1 Tax=Juglans microcarpa x Juglans regia TaxID=2249226 RepID=UPI001B7DD83F|nr:protein GRAVITROPIC IN THE LIGHT 1-like [Juglans microcarpa x Juglans regia]